LEPRNESSSFGKEDLQELQGRAAARHRLHHLFIRRPAQAAAGLTAVSQLKVERFPNILTRFFSRALVEK
jgi:hypothetical protein